MDIVLWEWIYPKNLSYIHGYTRDVDISMDISAADISRRTISMDISKRYIFFGYIRYPYIHGYIRYIHLYPKKIYLFSDISKNLYLFLDIVKMDVSGYIRNGCIQKTYIQCGYIQKRYIHYPKRYIQ